MELKSYVLGPIATNTYLLQMDNDVLLIDPASKPEKLIDILGDRNLLGILLTHGHFDHIKAVDGLYKKYNCPVYLHHDDEKYARDKYSGIDFGISSYITCPTISPSEGKNKIGPFEFNVIYTPGHTPGSLIYIFDNKMFTGDTLFRLSAGRTDLAGGDDNALRQSLKIFKYCNKDYEIYPGHDAPSSLSFELENNPYLK